MSHLDYDAFESFMICQIKQLPIRSKVVARETSKDQQLGRILRLLKDGKSLKQYGFKEPKTNYKLTAGCLLAITVLYYRKNCVREY